MINAKELPKEVETVKLVPVIGKGGPKFLTICGAEQTGYFLQSLIGDEAQECLVILYLDVKNSINYYRIVARGGISSAQCDVKVILQTALLTNSSSIIMAHNHPSGDLEPSRADIGSVNRLSKACKFLEVRFLDSFIVSATEYFSFAEHNAIQY